ncbi:MAG TPA: branched-chain amino acid ABC transporter permease, partial [Clostridiales bacterium]|nr:branched-chain amino acid ABC transporter permease [Clostridiales bacterium]
MSASLATKLEKNIKRWIPFIAFGITDEAFSIASFRQSEVTKEFILTVEIMGYVSWVGGTLLGYWAGGILPPAIQESMGVAIYAMFVTLLIPEVRKSFKIGLLACLSGMINTILNNIAILPQSWNLILAIVFSSAIGSCFFAEKEVHLYE